MYNKNKEEKKEKKQSKGKKEEKKDGKKRSRAKTEKPIKKIIEVFFHFILLNCNPSQELSEEEGEDYSSEEEKTIKKPKIDEDEGKSIFNYFIIIFVEP